MIMQRIGGKDMNNRRRLVANSLGQSWLHCDVHGWDFIEFEDDQEDDYCPVCLGETTERERVSALLALDDKLPRVNTRDGNWVHLDTLIALIRQEASK